MVATKYHFAGTSRIAMRVSSTLTYLLTDHLNSKSITTKSTGGLVSELRYKPWGETRYTSGTTSTKYQYTGQYSYQSDFGLMFYNTRWYDSTIGRFAQADSIIPGAGNSAAWDRYAYTLNNPLRYTDPSGHSVDCGAGDPFCSAGKYKPSGLINLYKQNHKKDELDSPYNSPKPVRDSLSQEIEDYLTENPRYSIKNDGQLDYGLFYSIRHDYWQKRSMEPGSGCDILADPDKLYRYYDLNQTVIVTKFDLAKISWPNVALDAAGIPLAIFGANTLKFGVVGGSILKTAGVVGSGVSTIDAGYKADPVGAGLAFASAFPEVGAPASGISLVRDLSQGIYKETWVPPIPR